MGDQPVARPLPTRDNTTQETQGTNIHALSGIRTHDPSNQPAKIHASDRTATVTDMTCHCLPRNGATVTSQSPGCKTDTLLCIHLKVQTATPSHFIIKLELCCEFSGKKFSPIKSLCSIYLAR
jgi:hypothetical protein